MAVVGKIELKDRRTVLVRGASAGDIPDIARLLGELSPESFRARFQAGLPKHVTGQRILVEQKSWYDDGRTAALRAAGHEIRHCSGPDHRTGRACPLVTSGECRLAEEADRIVPGLPVADPRSAAVVEAHRRMWPGKLPP